MQQKKSLTFSAGNMLCGKTNPINVFHLVLFICINKQANSPNILCWIYCNKESFWILVAISPDRGKHSCYSAFFTRRY